ncbi:hypothetical protein AgCh_006197 [Apium graveolens]
MNHTNTMKGNQENAKKKNMSIKLVAGGGGLAGIILLGGALALVTTFAFGRKPKSNKQKDSSNNSVEKADHKLVVAEGLSFLVPDSLSPHLSDHSSSNVTEDTQDEVSTHILLDESSETDVGNDEEMDISGKERINVLYGESTIYRQEFMFPVPVADSSLPLKPEEVSNMKDFVEKVEVRKVNEESATTDCNQVGDSYNDRQVPLRFDGSNRELVKAADTDDQLGLDGKTPEQGEVSDGNGKTITESKEILVEGAQSNQPGSHDDSHQLAAECHENGGNILQKRKEPIEAAARDQTRLDQMPHMGGEECDHDAGIINEKGEKLIGEVVAANGMILSEELEATTMNGDQDIHCSDGVVLIRNETETCNSNKPELLLQLIDSSEEHLVVIDTKILKEDEANAPAMQGDHGKVKDREQTQLVVANGENKEYYNTYRQNTKDKFEEAGEIPVENNQHMQSWQECQKIHVNEDQEINAFQSNDFQGHEFSFIPLDSPSLVKPGKLHKHDFAETVLHVEVNSPMEKDGLAEEVFSYQIMLEDKPSIQSAENDEMHIRDDGRDNAAAKGEKTLKKSLVDIAQPTNLIEEKDNNDDSKEEEEAVEIIRREYFEGGKNLQMAQEDHDNTDSIDREEYANDCDEGDVEDDSDEDDIDNDTEEEDNVEEVEESSETTGDSSLDSNTEAIWPDEPVLEFSKKVNDMQANNLNIKEIVEKDSYVGFNSHKLEDDDGDSFMMAYSTEKLSPDTTTLKQPPNLKFWFLSLLVPFLLLLWLSSSQLSYFTSFHYHLE